MQEVDDSLPEVLNDDLTISKHSVDYHEAMALCLC